MSSREQTLDNPIAMSCTIDHLQRDLRVRVLKDFTDLRGVHHVQGESGVIRDMGLEWSTQEIWIEWQLADRLEKIYFKLSSKEGPGNGRMKQYFEPEESPQSSPTPTHTPAAPPSSMISSPDSIPYAHTQHPQARNNNSPPATSKQPATSTCLNEKRVSCPCDPGYHREIYPHGNLLVNACLHCGTVSVSHSVGDDGRYTGNAWTAYWTDPVPDEVLNWLADWPRVKSDLISESIPWPMSADYVEYSRLVYPPSTRCTSIQNLADLDAKLHKDQRKESFAQQLKRWIPVSRPIPDGLPRELLGFVDVWQAARLRSSSDLNSLIHLAHLRNPASELAVDLLLQRNDALSLTIAALRSDDPLWNNAGHAMARRLPSTPQILFETIFELLESLPLTPSADVDNRLKHATQFEALLLLLIRLKAPLSESELHLRRFQSRVARLDGFMVSCIQTTLSQLRAI